MPAEHQAFNRRRRPLGAARQVPPQSAAAVVVGLGDRDEPIRASRAAKWDSGIPPLLGAAEIIVNFSENCQRGHANGFQIKRTCRRALPLPLPAGDFGTSRSATTKLPLHRCRQRGEYHNDADIIGFVLWNLADQTSEFLRRRELRLAGPTLGGVRHLAGSDGPEEIRATCAEVHSARYPARSSRGTCRGLRRNK
jgi:hypothetical protein